VESAGIKEMDLKKFTDLDSKKLADNVFEDKPESKPAQQKKFDQDAT